jgi:hypothetical protein
VRCIWIKDRPTGDVPPEIRDAWIDCVLPLDMQYPVVPGYWTRRVVNANKSGDGGYAVDALLAVDILHETQPDAAEWWRTQPYISLPGFRFVFCKPACRLIDTIPGVGFDSCAGELSVGEVLDQLGGMHEMFAPWVALIAGRIPNQEWQRIRASRINDIIVRSILISLADEIRQRLPSSNPEDYLVLGQTMFEAIHKISRGGSLRCMMGRYVLPLGWYDLLFREGVLSRDRHDIIVWTLYGERVADHLGLPKIERDYFSGRAVE